MKITWIGHSCFRIEKNGYCIVIDPYTAGSVPGYDPVSLSANEVLCSHEHGDHNGRNEVQLVPTDNVVSPFQVDVLDTWHDEVQGAKRGPNKIFLISDGTHRIAHLGDLGCMLSDSQIESLKNLDVLLIPIGGYYTIDDQQAAEVITALTPKHVVPMHFRDDQAGFGYAEIGTSDHFIRRMNSVLSLQTCEVSAAELPDQQVIVLQPLRSRHN
ncbi:MAG: MBL fold metallo-hydrolase [Lachnospiraceae bacterium]|nr:MBL fold metallo-hydrolase [Lachnospiraceae bacterium]